MPYQSERIHPESHLFSVLGKDNFILLTGKIDSSNKNDLSNKTITFDNKGYSKGDKKKAANKQYDLYDLEVEVSSSELDAIRDKAIPDEIG